MAYFVKLTNANGREPVSVNVDLVTHFMPLDGGTHIFFGAGHSVQVKETPEQFHAEMQSEQSNY